MASTLLRKPLESFREQDFLHLREVLPGIPIRNCLRLLMGELGVPEGDPTPPAKLSAERERETPSATGKGLKRVGGPAGLIPGGNQEGMGKFQGRIANSPRIRGLLAHPRVASVLRQLFGPTGAEVSNPSAQIACRFPEIEGYEWEPEEAGERPPCPRIDDTAWHTDGLRQGKAHPFSVLCGVVLSATTEDFQGNLVLWPGSHRTLHACAEGPYGALDLPQLREKLGLPPNVEGGGGGKEESVLDARRQLRDAEQAIQNQKQAKAKTGAEVVAEVGKPAEGGGEVGSIPHDNEPPDLPPLGTPLQLQAQPGDLILLHPETAHMGGPNHSPTIRSMVYFRLRCRVSRDKGEGAAAEGGLRTWGEVVRSHVGDMWSDLPGVRDAGR